VQIYRIVGNVADAQDLTQEAFIKALQRQEQLKDGQKAAHWLSRIATNTAIDFLRRSGPYLTASWMSSRLHARGRHAMNAERGRDLRRQVILAYKRMTRKVAQKEGFHLRRIDVPVLEALLASFHRERSKVLAGERPKRRLPDSYYGAGLIYHSSATHYRC
jgi:hypothetical protein